MEMLTIIIICIILFVIQLLLCFKAKKRLIQLIPVILLLIAFAVSMFLLRTATGWDALGYIVFVLLSGIFLISCVAGWVIWAVSYWITKKKSN